MKEERRGYKGGTRRGKVDLKGVKEEKEKKRRGKRNGERKENGAAHVSS